MTREITFRNNVSSVAPEAPEIPVSHGRTGGEREPLCGQSESRWSGELHAALSYGFIKIQLQELNMCRTVSPEELFGRLQESVFFPGGSIMALKFESTRGHFRLMYRFATAVKYRYHEKTRRERK